MNTNNKGWEGLHPISKHAYVARYFTPGETYDEWLERVTEAYKEDDDHKDRMKRYIRNYWFHPSTPISTNAGIARRGFPISCFVHNVPDNKDGIFKALEEDFFLSSKGAGIGSDWSGVREAGAMIRYGGVASGAIPFVKSEETLVNSVSQGGVRRGSFSPSTKVNNPDILPWIQLKNPIGDPTLRALESFPAVVITDEFMNAVINGEDYSLISPKSGLEVGKADAREVWSAIIKMRLEKGVPFLLFEGNVMNGNPEIYKKLGINVKQSNLCMEIVLETNDDKANVCVLSSINMEHYDEFKGEVQQMYRDIHVFMDNVVGDFISSSDGVRGFERARVGAMDERPLGIGVMGLSYLYQKRGVEFDGLYAKHLNKLIFKELSEILEESNKEQGISKGSCPMAVRAGIVQRNSHLTAIAPTASISTLAGLTSPGIDPLLSNVFSHKTNIGEVVIVNKYLKETIDRLIKDGTIVDMLWEDIEADIIANEGSIQSLDYIPQEYKGIFKTAYEIDQQAIIELASDRAKYITQSQSVNLFIARGTDSEYVSDLHMLAWAKRIKSLYYVRGQSAYQSNATKVGAKAGGAVESNNEIEECFYCG